MHSDMDNTATFGIPSKPRKKTKEPLKFAKTEESENLSVSYTEGSTEPSLKEREQIYH